MKVLMISIDKGLLGKNPLGDVVSRHTAYGQKVDQLDIIVFSTSGIKENKLSDKVTVYPTNSANKLKYYFDGLSAGKKLFVKNKYDLIITQEPFVTGMVGMKLKKLFGAKLLVHFHGDFWNNKNWLKENKLNKIFLKVSQYVVPKADGIRVVSQGIKEKLVNQGIAEEKIFVISTPVNLEKYQLTSPSESNQPTVLHVSRYDKVKDFTTLGKAFSKIVSELSQIKLIQVGGGDQAAKEINNVTVEVLPLVDHLSLVKYFQQASVVVLSSTSESFGKVLVEAAACGKPVVSTATTGAKEIITDGLNGFLVPIGDADALAEKTIWLLNNPEHAKEMGQQGLAIVKQKYGDNLNKVTELWYNIVKL